MFFTMAVMDEVRRKREVESICVASATTADLRWGEFRHLGGLGRRDQEAGREGMRMG